MSNRDKIAGIEAIKEWACLRQCKSNCCSEMFLKVSIEQRKTFEDAGYIVGEKDYSDWDWVKYHEGLMVNKLFSGSRVIRISKNTPARILHYKDDTYYLHIHSKCTQLLKDGKCRAYIQRPKICRQSECVFFSDKPLFKWFKENSSVWKKEGESNDMQGV